MLYIFIDSYNREELSQIDALRATLFCLDNSQLEPDNTVIVVPSADLPKVTPFTSLTCVDYKDDCLSNMKEGDVILRLNAGTVFPPEAVKKGLESIRECNCVSVVASSIFCNHVNASDSLKFVKNNGDADSWISVYERSVPENEVCVTGIIASDSFDWETALPNNSEVRYPVRNVWAFCAGQYSNDFRGNPKYLFLYLNEHRSDIYSYWLCENIEIIALLRSLGLPAFKLNTPLAEKAINETGVLVSEFVKMSIPAGLENAVYLNLWHGVGGVKNVERALTTGVLTEDLAKKYIQKNSFYRTHEMYLAPSLFIEHIAEEQLGLSEKQIIRAGYPRCRYESPVHTFDHDKFISPKLPAGVRFAVYIPTYRNNPKGDLFSLAVPDMERLVKVLKEENICLIFKMHPLLVNSFGFKKASEVYKDCPYLYFWDNRDDFYEVIKKVDLCIMDYSSMFTDFIASGCKHFIRYTFDFTGDDLDFPLSYEEATLGRMCNSFDELLSALRTYRDDNLEADLKRIGNLYWEYSDSESFDRIVSSTLSYSIPENNFKTLYSFDIFDTLISRKGLVPESIFYKVRERMEEHGGFPKYLTKNYPEIRHNAELNMREYYTRSCTERCSSRTEISFNEIINRIKILFELTDEQSSLLAEYEKEAELSDVVPVPEYVSQVKDLVKNGETVVLISDMYHDFDFIREMLRKADPVLSEIPLFLSSVSGHQKSSKQLFVEVYRSFGTEYAFDRWIHTGDNPRSDGSMPKTLNILPNLVKPPVFNDYEKGLVEKLQSYDAYLIAASLARFREKNKDLKAYFAYAYVSFLWVPYLHWALNSAVKRGDEIVYFVSRDGHQFKFIADAIKSSSSLDIETRYIYASRRTWRIPSFFDHIDVGFWGQGYGNVAHVSSFTQLLKALELDADTFYSMFPSLSYLNEESVISEKEIVDITAVLKVSDKYEQYLLSLAEKQRVATCGYLKQEIDPSKQFSIIEYWGRGYTQENFTRLWQYITGRKDPTVFYYSRSTLPSDRDNIRLNYTSNSSSQAFIESIFSCINYKTIQKYECVDGRWNPVIQPQDCDYHLFESMEEFLPLFAKEYCTLPLKDRETTGRALIDFAIDWHRFHPEWEGFREILAIQVDSVQMYGDQKQYAPPLTDETLNKIEAGLRRNQVSKNIAISYYRSSSSVQSRFRDMFQIREGDLLTSGIKLSPENIARNIASSKELDLLKLKNAQRQKMYDRACSWCQVQNLVLVLTKEAKFSRQSYDSLLKALENQNVFRVSTYALKSQRLPFEILASARYIVTLEPLEYLSELVLRKGSELVVLGNTATSYFYRGLSKDIGLKYLSDLERLKQCNDISIVHVPSLPEAERAKQIYNLHHDSRIMQTGSVVTDCYWSELFRKETKERFLKIFPEAKGKKVIAYAPLYRMRNNKSNWLSLLDISKLQKEIGNDYVIALNINGNVDDCSNVVEFPGFSKDLSTRFSLRELMCVADIIIADYRDTIFEAPLAGVPVFVTSWDCIKFDSTSKVYDTFDNMLYGVPVCDTHDLIDKLKNIDNYDNSYRNAFISKYLSKCDGHSAERLVKSLTESFVKSAWNAEVSKVLSDNVWITLSGITEADYYQVYGIAQSSELCHLCDICNDGYGLMNIEIKKYPEYIINAVCSDKIVGSQFVEISHSGNGSHALDSNVADNTLHCRIKWLNAMSAADADDGQTHLTQKALEVTEWNNLDARYHSSEYDFVYAHKGIKSLVCGSVITDMSEKSWSMNHDTSCLTNRKSPDVFEICQYITVLGMEVQSCRLKYINSNYYHDSCENCLKVIHIGASAFNKENVTCFNFQFPAVPTRVDAVQKKNEYVISWQRDHAVTEYLISVLSANNDVTTVGAVLGSVCEWHDSERRNNIVGYRVEAVRKIHGCSLYSGYSKLARPVMDLGLCVDYYSKTKRQFRWNRMPSVDVYEFYSWDKKSKQYKLVSRLNSSINTYRYVTNSPADKGSFKLLGLKNKELVAFGSFDHEPVILPKVPLVLDVHSSGKDVTVSWNGDPNVTRWNVIPVLAGNRYAEVKKVPGHVTHWVDYAGKFALGYILEAVKEKDGVAYYSGYSKTAYVIHPLNLRLASTNGKAFVIKWDKSPLCETYKLFKRVINSEQKDLVKECTSKENSIVEQNCKVNDIYYIEGYNKGNLCATGTVQLEDYVIPNKPSDFNVTVRDGVNILTWSQLPDVTCWNIRLISAGEEKGRVVSLINDNINEWEDSILDESTVGYQLEAVIEKDGVKCCSGYSEPVLVTNSLSIPISLKFAWFRVQTCKIMWNKSRYADLYKVYKKIDSKSERTFLAECSGKTGNFIDRNYSKGNMYEVEAYSRDSLISRECVEVHDVTLPTKPENLKVTSVDNGHLLCWINNPNVTEWDIKPILSDGKPGNLLAIVPNTSKEDSMSWLNNNYDDNTIGYIVEAVIEKGGVKYYSGYCIGAKITAKSKFFSFFRGK